MAGRGGRCVARRLKHTPVRHGAYDESSSTQMAEATRDLRQVRGSRHFLSETGHPNAELGLKQENSLRWKRLRFDRPVSAVPARPQANWTGFPS